MKPLKNPANADKPQYANSAENLLKVRNLIVIPWRGLHFAFRDIPSFRHLVLGSLVGVFAGLVAVCFHLGLEWLKGAFLVHLAGADIPTPGRETLFDFAPGAPRLWLIPIATTLVGLATGWLLPRLIAAEERSGTDGTDTLIRAFHGEAASISTRAPILRGLTAILTIASGGSAGREGPISLLGAGVGSFFSRHLGLGPKERRIMLLSGAAGGLGAIFRSPLGGALTAIEIIYREDFESEAIIPAIASSVTAYFVFTLFFGSDPILALPNLRMTSTAELPLFAALALACAVGGGVYVRVFRYFKYRVFDRVRDAIGPALCAGLGGLLVGLLGVGFPQVLSDGWGWIEKAASGELTLTVMAAIIVGKTLATSLTIGSGMSGGMFAPALLVGGMCGGLVGGAAQRVWPETVAGPGGFVMVGMAAFFSGMAKSPIGPLVMVCEMTQGYSLLGPLMLSTAICLVLARNTSLYEFQVDSKFDSPAHEDDLVLNTLEHMPVRNYYHPRRVAVVEESTCLRALADILANSSEQAFPVRGHDGVITGILVPHDLRQVLQEESLYDLLVARDLYRKVAILHPDDNLYAALQKFMETGSPQLPVVSPADGTHVLGLLSRDDVFRAYSRKMASCRRS